MVCGKRLPHTICYHIYKNMSSGGLSRQPGGHPGDLNLPGSIMWVRPHRQRTPIATRAGLGPYGNLDCIVGIAWVKKKDSEAWERSCLK